MCPIQFHFILFISLSIDFWWVILHSSSFVILSVHFIFIIRLKYLFTNICGLLVIWLVVFQVSQAYNNTDFTFVLNIRILTFFDMLRLLHTGYSWTNTPFAFLILLATSSSDNRLVYEINNFNEECKINNTFVKHDGLFPHFYSSLYIFGRPRGRPTLVGTCRVKFTSVSFKPVQPLPHTGVVELLTKLLNVGPQYK